MPRLVNYSLCTAGSPPPPLVLHLVSSCLESSELSGGSNSHLHDALLKTRGGDVLLRVDSGWIGCFFFPLSSPPIRSEWGGRRQPSGLGGGEGGRVGSSAFVTRVKLPLFKQVAALSCLKEHYCSTALGF